MEGVSLARSKAESQ